MRSRQRGFSVLEVVLSVLVVGILSAALLGSYVAYVDQTSKDETRTRLRALRSAMLEAYRSNIMSIGNAADAALIISGITIASGADATPALLQPLERHASLAAGVLARDGFQRPVRLFVSDALSANVAGTALVFRTVAIVSGGRNGTVESTWSTATGTLTLRGDDVAEIANGYGLVRALYDDSQARLERIAGRYQSYFVTRYLANPARTIATDYFARTDPAGQSSPSWDGAGDIPSSGGAARAASDLDLARVLGFASTDLVTLAGAPIAVDNSSDAVNHPNNTSPARALPPYTARVIAPLPGNIELVRTIAGHYN